MKRERKLTFTQLRTLAAVSRGPETTAELARWLKIHPVTALHAMRRLALSGLVDLETRRLTAKGRSALKNANTNLEAMLAEVRA